MKSKIIISYRRSDSDVITGRIRDRLASQYGEGAVFMDVENIPLGFDYRKQIKDALLQNTIFVAVIGPKWLGGSGKEARINEENDPVRIEVETAFQQGIPVIPVLVSGATIPKATELPPSLQTLCYLNAAEVDGGRDFRRDMERLIQAIDQIWKTIGGAASLSKSRKWILPSLGAIACLILLAIGIWAYPSILAYLKSPAPTQVAVQPAPQPPPAPQPTPAPQPAPAPPPVVTPPPRFSSAACNPEKAAFYDDFHNPVVGWNFTPDDRAKYADGQLIFTPRQNGTYATRYLRLKFENATICAHIKSPPQVKDPLDALGGIIFWSADSENYYLITIAPDGSYRVQRRLAGAWINLGPLTKNNAVKPGTNAVNEIRVELVDNFGALFINDVKVQEFRGQPPSGGATVGVYAESEANASNEWRFLDIAVMDNGKSKPVVLPRAPSGPTFAGCQAVNSTDFQDTFAAPDPAWALDGSDAHYVDGQLSIKTNRGRYYAALYRPLVFRNATLCATVKSPPETENLDEIGAGLAFRASDYRNFYTARVYLDGTFRIAQNINGEWIFIIPSTPSNAIKKGAGAVNEIQVVLNNNNGLLYINGVQVHEFRGQLQQLGGSIGVIAAGGDWRFLNITAVENQ